MAGYEHITLEKGMYSVPGKSFTQVLEELDRSEQYRGTPLEGLDAFQRQLKRFDIKVSGPGSDPVERFFATSAGAALFPEYVSRAVRQGMERVSQVNDLVATVTRIDGMDYRTIDAEDETWQAAVVSEGAQLPQTTLRLGSGLVPLHKRGRVLSSSYEALRFQKLDLLTVALGQIGAGIAAAQLEDAVDVLINGDGSKDGITFASSTSLSYADFLKLWGSLAPYQLNAIAAGTGGIQKLLQISEFKDAQAGHRQAGHSPGGRPGPCARHGGGQDHRPGQELRPGDGPGWGRAGGQRQAHRPAAGEDLRQRHCRLCPHF